MFFYKVYGGHGYFRKLRRPFWELYRAIVVSPTNPYSLIICIFEKNS